MIKAEEKEEVARACFEDHALFCKTFLSDWFPGEITWLHRGMMAIMTRRCGFLTKYGEVDKIIDNFTWLDAEGDEHPIFSWEGANLVMTLGQYVALAVPRGIGKSTIAKSVLISDMCYRVSPVTLFVSETMTFAVQGVTDIRHQFETNEVLHEIFGYNVPGRQDPQAWNDEMIQLTTGPALLPRGGGQQVRGTNVNVARPKKILVDDFEDDESVATPEQRAKRRNWFYGALKPALPRLDKEATITVIGTILHPEALLPSLAKDPQWTVTRLAVLDKDGEAVWPEYMTLEEVEAERQSYALAGTLSKFYLEYFNLPIADDTQKFQQRFFRHEPAPDLGSLIKAIAIDPAISDKVDADFTAIVVVGISPRTGMIYVLDVWSKRGATPREQVDKYFELAKRWRPRHHGVEAIAYQAALVHLLREEMFRQKYYFEITKLTHTQKKTERVEGILQPRYANGYIIHTRHFPELEAQLLAWPMGKKDLPDATAMAVSLLDPHASFAATGDPAADEYEPLDTEMMEI